jgi:hypothetical protein
VRSFFRQLQNILEITLLPLNLSKLTGRARSDVISRMREKNALRLLDLHPIAEDVAYRPLTQALEDREIGYDLSKPDELLGRWRQLERTALGLADDYVRIRLNQREHKLREAQMLNVDPALVKAAFKKYVGDLIDGLLAGTRQVWLPLAIDFIKSWKPKPGQNTTRAPIAFRLHLPTGGMLNLGPILDGTRRGDEGSPVIPETAWSSLDDAPDLVFALAACVALASEDWSNANHFAEMALRAYEATAGGTGRIGEVAGAHDSRVSDGEASSHAAGADETRQFDELRYLNALTRRFALGSISPPLNPDGLVQARRGYLAARELLDACVVFHESAEEGRGHRLRLIRALSERDALNLFYAAAMAPAVRHAAWSRLTPRQRSDLLGENRGYPAQNFESSEEFDHPRDPDAGETLLMARADLRRCLATEKTLPALDEHQRAFFSRVERQFLINTAAAAALSRLIEGTKPDHFGEAERTGVVDPQLVSRMRSLLAKLGPNLKPLLRAELLAFFSMTGDEKALDELRHLKSGEGAPGKLLSLDAALFEAIRKGFVADSGSGGGARARAG